jgi:hypothetical protein
MFAELRRLKDLMRVAALAVVLMVAGCGGGGGDDGGDGGDSGSTGGNDNSPTNPVVCFILILATGDTNCTQSGNSAPPSSPPPSSSTAPTSAGAALVLRPNGEFEPNGDLANANLPASPTRSSPDQEIGWYVDGSIDEINDVTDSFAFTPNQTRQYDLALCPPESSICDRNTGIDTLTAFFRVLDQDGNVLLTSQADTVNGNKHRMTFDAGVLYYVTVDAGDTMGSIVGYRLFVYELP